MNSSRHSRVGSRDFPVRFSQLPSSADETHRSDASSYDQPHRGTDAVLNEEAKNSLY